MARLKLMVAEKQALLDGFTLDIDWKPMVCYISLTWWPIMDNTSSSRANKRFYYRMSSGRICIHSLTQNGLMSNPTTLRALMRLTKAWRSSNQLTSRGFPVSPWASIWQGIRDPTTGTMTESNKVHTRTHRGITTEIVGPTRGGLDLGLYL